MCTATCSCPLGSDNSSPSVETGPGSGAVTSKGMWELWQTIKILEHCVG